MRGGREGGREIIENPDTFNAFLAELDRDIEVRLVFNYKSDEVQFLFLSEGFIHSNKTQGGGFAPGALQ